MTVRDRSAGKPDWREQVRRTIDDVSDLPLSSYALAQAARVAQTFPMRIPPHLFRAIDWHNPRCPIRRQLVPHRDELILEGTADPLAETRFEIEQGVIRRFSDRLLALVSNSCPALCRHCNRKRSWLKPFVPAGEREISRALAQSTNIREVILSGGEPLLLADSRLDKLLQTARSSESVELVRIHSRAPVTLPQRLSKGLMTVLRRHRPLWLVTHFNHALELTPEAQIGLHRLVEAGIPVLNQAVLLRGVNDSIKAQEELGRALLRNGVKPHYLFQLDRARGTVHFQVPIHRALAIVDGLQRKHSGLLVPRLMVDLPGRGGKVPLNAGTIIKRDTKGIWLKGADGRARCYQST